MVSGISLVPFQYRGRSDGPPQAEPREKGKKGMSAKEIIKNPALARLLVKAAKLKKAHDERQLDSEKV